MIVVLHMQLEGQEHAVAAAIQSTVRNLNSFMHVKVSAMPEVKKREKGEEAVAEAQPSKLVRSPLSHPSDGHSFIPNRCYPSYCGDCGYGEGQHTKAVPRVLD